MKLFMIGAVAASLALGGCQTTGVGTSVFDGGQSLLASITNPIGEQEMIAMESAYRAALVAAVNYRRLGLCRRGQSISVTNVCADRGVVLKLQAADRRVHGAMIAARNFVRDNPTISAFSAINAARTAIFDFQNVVATNGVQ